MRYFVIQVYNKLCFASHTGYVELRFTGRGELLWRLLLAVIHSIHKQSGVLSVLDSSQYYKVLLAMVDLTGQSNIAHIIGRAA